MDAILQKTCESFIRNRDLLKDNFRYEGMVMHMVGAAVMTASGDELGIKDYLKCEDFLDSKAGVLSSLRGIFKMPMIINMAMSKKPDKYYDTVQKVFEEIKEERGSKDERLYPAAMIIASAATTAAEISDMVETAGKIFDLTDASTRFFADMSCYFTATSVAAEGVRYTEAFKEEFERCKEELRLDSGIGMVPEDLCMLIASKPGDTKEKCERVKEISATLGAKGVALGSGDAASMLSSLSTLDMKPEEIAEAVSDADNFLKDQKGFGFMGIGKSGRHLYAALLTKIAYSGSTEGGNTVVKAAVSDAIESLYAMMIHSTNMMHFATIAGGR